MEGEDEPAPGFRCIGAERISQGHDISHPRHKHKHIPPLAGRDFAVKAL